MKKTFTLTRFLCLVLVCLCLSACQKTDSAIDDTWQDNDLCSNDFERENNTLHSAPFWSVVGLSETSALAKEDTDFWKFAIKANSKGKIPTQIVYELALPSTVMVAIYRHDTLYTPPKYTTTFRPNLSEKITIDSLKVGELVTVEIRHLAGEPTCYGLRFQ